jgi:hypothetical protein
MSLTFTTVGINSYTNDDVHKSGINSYINYGVHIGLASSTQEVNFTKAIIIT